MRKLSQLPIQVKSSFRMTKRLWIFTQAVRHRVLQWALCFVLVCFFVFFVLFFVVVFFGGGATSGLYAHWLARRH